MRTHRLSAAVVAVVLALVGLVLVAPAVGAATVNKVVCNATALNVRSGPGSTYAIVGTLAGGASVTGSRSGTTSWFLIDSGNYTGRYVALGYLCDPAPAGGTARVVTGSSLNVRTGPSTTGTSVVGVLSRGQNVMATAVSASWLRITGGQYAGRYIYAAYTQPVTLTAAPGTTVLPTTARQVIVAASVTASSGTIAWYQWDGWRWTTSGSAGATFGPNGVREGTVRVEGDGTTPLGTYPMLMEFGTSRLGSSLPFRQVTDCSWWISDGAAPDYNRWREACGPQGYANVRLMTHVTNTVGEYRHAAVIGFNHSDPVRPPNAGSGSGVMLHYKPLGQNTTGCVGVTDRAKMEAILAWMRASDNPTIVIKRA